MIFMLKANHIQLQLIYDSIFHLKHSLKEQIYKKKSIKSAI